MASVSWQSIRRRSSVAGRPRRLRIQAPLTGTARQPRASPLRYGRGAGLTPGLEQSAGGSGRTYRNRSRARTARGTGPAAPAGEPAEAPDALLTIEEVITQLQVSRAAFYRWRRRGTGPAEVRLPGGGVQSTACPSTMRAK
jgi:predicted DNA-binding transcriptional regulator AlpA